MQNSNIPSKYPIIKQSSIVEAEFVNDVSSLDKILKKGKKETEEIQNFIDKYHELKHFNLKQLEHLQLEKNQFENEQQKYFNIIRDIHLRVLSFIHSRGVTVWKDYDSNNLYYRINVYGKREKGNITKITSDIGSIIGIELKIYNDVPDIIYNNESSIITKWIPFVQDDVFYPNINLEFFQLNNINYRNTYQYTSFLEYRFVIIQKFHIAQQINQLQLAFQSQSYISPEFQQPPHIQNQIQQLEQQVAYLQNQLQTQSSVIQDFIFSLSQSESQFHYIMDWLAYTYRTLNKSNIALVLIGDKETTDILVNKIIRPIFAFKEDYFATINDATLTKTNETILKDKIFYHIDELTPDNTKDKRTSKLVREILKFNRISSENAVENNRSYIYGQLIISYSKETPYPLLKENYNHCTVFKVKHLNTILKELNLLHLDFEDKTLFDLDNFSKILAQYPVDLRCCKPFDTDEKSNLSTMRKGILMTQILEEKIQQFIDAIKEQNTEYFKPLELGNDESLYKELVENFDNDDEFINQN